METNGMTIIERDTMNALINMSQAISDIRDTLCEKEPKNQELEKIFRAFVKEFYVISRSDDECMNALIKCGCDEKLAKQLGVDWAFTIGREYNESMANNADVNTIEAEKPTRRTIREVKPGDVIICNGIRAKVKEIISQYTDPVYDENGTLVNEYHAVEFTDTAGHCRYWKQRTDGGRVIRGGKAE